MLEQVIDVVVKSVLPFLIGSIGVWFYYREKNQELAEALADKTAIVTSLLSHSDELEKQNVKVQTKKHNAKVAKKEKVVKPAEKPKRKYKKQSV